MTAFGIEKNHPLPAPPDSSEHLLGMATLEYHNGYLFTIGRTAGSRTGSFIVDFGAGSTLIDATMLSDSIMLSTVPPSHIKNTSGNVIDGFGGAISEFAGYTDLSWVRIGSRRWENAIVRVIDSLPRIGGRRIIGILGMDLLMRTPVVSYSYGEDTENTTMYFLAEDAGDEAKPTISIPFTIIGNHIFIMGQVNGTPVRFILDTGSAENILMTTAAKEANIGIDTTVIAEFSGLDGMTISAQIGLADSIALESFKIAQVRFHVADLPSLSPPNTKQNIGVLGNSLLRQYDRITIDFKRQVINLTQR